MREFVSGREIQARVQSLVDQDPAVLSDRKKVIVPMPKPSATEDETGCNWTIAYRGIADGHEDIVKACMAIVQHEVNIGGPSVIGAQRMA
jgi:hypothetical protein